MNIPQFVYPLACRWTFGLNACNAPCLRLFFKGFQSCAYYFSLPEKNFSVFQFDLFFFFFQWEGKLGTCYTYMNENLTTVALKTVFLCVTVSGSEKQRFAGWLCSMWSFQEPWFLPSCCIAVPMHLYGWSWTQSCLSTSSHEEISLSWNLGMMT